MAVVWWVEGRMKEHGFIHLCSNCGCRKEGWDSMALALGALLCFLERRAMRSFLSFYSLIEVSLLHNYIPSISPRLYSVLFGFAVLRLHLSQTLHASLLFQSKSCCLEHKLVMRVNEIAHTHSLCIFLL